MITGSGMVQRGHDKLSSEKMRYGFAGMKR
jgi:hypothetical protein